MPSQRQPEPIRPAEIRDTVVAYLPGRTPEECASLKDHLPSILDSSIGASTGRDQEDSEVALYFMGPDAHTLFTAVEPALRSQPLANTADIMLASGEHGNRTYIRLFPQTPAEIAASNAAWSIQ